MINLENVIKGLEICSEHDSWHGLDCEHNGAYKDCPYRGCETGCVVTIAKDALALLKEQEETISSFQGTIRKLNAALEEQPDIVRCKDCKNWIAGYITDQDDFIPSKCGKYKQMVGHSSDDFCSLAERW